MLPKLWQFKSKLIEFRLQDHIRLMTKVKKTMDCGFKSALIYTDEKQIKFKFVTNQKVKYGRHFFVISAY